MDARSVSPVVSPAALDARRAQPGLVVVDCRFDLGHPEAGLLAYREGHVPGAVYAHLERDLSDMSAAGRGRHPLPGPDALQRTFGRLGIDATREVVAYDAGDCAFASRLWWLLRYMGHEAVSVLDGGWRAWCAAGLPRSDGPEEPRESRFHGAPRREWVVKTPGVAHARRLIDARDPRRYRGEVEPLDPVAGHIPGAVNHFFKDNLNADGSFLAAEEVRRRLLSVLGDCPPGEAVFYCGSGVTACHNLLALAHAGLPAGRLYPGSWSEWCGDPRRPAARGEND